MSKHSKEKGKRGEREAAAEMRRVLRCEAIRGQQFAGGTDSPDVKISIPGIHTEVKRVEKLRLWDALDQATRDAGDKLPLILTRANERPWLAIVRLDDLPKLITQLYLHLAGTA